MPVLSATSTPVRHTLPSLSPLRSALAAHRPAVARGVDRPRPAARPAHQSLL